MAQDAAPVMLRVNIAGFIGAPASVYGAYDPATDLLTIVREGKLYDGGPREGWLKITSSDRDGAYDALFKPDEEMREAIVAFFELDAHKLLNLQSAATRFNPANKIERDGMDESGLKFNIHPDAGNAQVAVLAAALWVGRQRGFQSAKEFGEEMRLLSIY